MPSALSRVPLAWSLLLDVEAVALGSALGSLRDAVAPIGVGAAEFFLAGQGAVLAEMVGWVAPLWAEGVGARASVAPVLEGLGSPEELPALAAGILHAPTQEILASSRGLTVELLGACGDPVSFESLVPGFARQWALVDRRLSEAGV